MRLRLIIYIYIKNIFKSIQDTENKLKYLDKELNIIIPAETERLKEGAKRNPRWFSEKYKSILKVTDRIKNEISKVNKDREELILKKEKAILRYYYYYPYLFNEDKVFFYDTNIKVDENYFNTIFNKNKSIKKFAIL